MLARTDIVSYAARIEAAWNKTRDGIFEVGRLLIEAKAALPHGGGARVAAVDWFRRECSQIASKQIRPLSLTDARQMIKRLAAETA